MNSAIYVFAWIGIIGSTVVTILLLWLVISYLLEKVMRTSTPRAYLHVAILLAKLSTLKNRGELYNETVIDHIVYHLEGIEKDFPGLAKGLAWRIELIYGKTSRKEQEPSFQDAVDEINSRSF